MKLNRLYFASNLERESWQHLFTTGKFRLLFQEALFQAMISELFLIFAWKQLKSQVSQSYQWGSRAERDFPP